MGYMMTIYEVDLSLPEEKAQEVDITETFLDWYWGDTDAESMSRLEPGDNCFDWDEEL